MTAAESRTGTRSVENAIVVAPDVVTKLWLSVGIVRFPAVGEGEIVASRYRERAWELAREKTCRVIEFYVSAMPHLPSGLLGLMASLIREHDVKVRVRGASADVREVLKVSPLHRVVSLVV